jgi:hypothetical protein
MSAAEGWVPCPFVTGCDEWVQDMSRRGEPLTRLRLISLT